MFQPFFFFLLFQGVILTVPADTFVSQLTKTTILIDVRTPEEFDEGHLSGAVNVSVTSIDFVNQINEFSKKGPIYVYCRSGKRSNRAAKIMKADGFRLIIELEGGYLAWQIKNSIAQ
tara:strand:- start:35 stop:385 length:351 start_codon:yes stop_codon:yes gene_type:complete